MTVETKPLNQITTEALRILFDTLGIANTIRFLNQFSEGYGDYTEERRQLENLAVDDIVAQIKKEA